MAHILQEHIGFHYLQTKKTVYFDLFEIEYTSQEVFNKINKKSITYNAFRTQSDDFIMCWFYCNVFIEYMIAGKTLLQYTHLFSPDDYQNNNRIAYKICTSLHRPWMTHNKRCFLVRNGVHLGDQWNSTIWKKIEKYEKVKAGDSLVFNMITGTILQNCFKVLDLLQWKQLNHCFL